MKKLLLVALAAATSSVFAAAQPEPDTKVFNLTTTTKQLEYKLVKKSKTFKEWAEAWNFNATLKTKPEYAPASNPVLGQKGKSFYVTWEQYVTKKVNGVDVKVTQWVTVKQNYLLVVGKDKSGKCATVQKLLAYDKPAKRYRWWEIDKNNVGLNMNYEDSGDVSINMTINDAKADPGVMTLCGSGKAAYSNPNDKKKDKTFPDYVTSASGNLVFPGGKHHRFGTWKLSYDKKVTAGGTDTQKILDTKKINPRDPRDFD